MWTQRLTSHDTTRLRPGRAAVLGILALAIGVRADEPGAGRSGEKPARLILFDGKTLDGWKKAEFFHAGEVRVEDGAIIMDVGGPMTGITTTRSDLPTTDYELSYQAMRLKGNDFFAAATFPVGKSHLTFVNGGWGGTVTGLSSLNGADASENDTGRFHRFAEKTWYRFRIRATDAVVRCWIDEEEFASVEHRERQVGTRIEVNRNKPLGFATYDTRGAIRKIELRALTPGELQQTNQVPEP
jgi:hypothetical protein